jgi:cell filamentation protein, protein adenylyltransferase
VSRGRPTRSQVLARFDRSINDLWAVGGLPLPVEAEGIWEGIWHEETHHSTAMEGNTLVLRQVKVLLEEGRAVGNKDLREYLEIEGYGDAAKWVYANAVRRHFGEDTGAALVTVGELRKIHKLVMEPVWSRFPDDQAQPAEGPGGFRSREIEPLRPGLPVAPWVHVRPRLDDWIAAVQAGPEEGEHFLCYLARMHAGFERLHPFRDGNGRVGRLVTNLLLVRASAPPAIINKTVRTPYLRALARADDGDPGPLSELLARAVRTSVEKHILPALAGPSRLVPLGSLETRKLSRGALLSAAKRERLQTVRLGDQYYSSRRWVQQYASSRHQGRRAA